MQSTADETKWLRGRSASLRGALLGLLLERPGYGGDLAARLAGRLGETWAIDYQDVYRLLEQLEENGLARTDVQPRPGQRQVHTVYFPTPQTQAAVSLWMETHMPLAPVRIGMQAKLAVARDEDAPRLLVALKTYEQECLELLQSMPEAASSGVRSWKQLFIDCTREGVEGQLHQEIEWAQRTRLRIRERVAAVREGRA